VRLRERHELGGKAGGVLLPAVCIDGGDEYLPRVCVLLLEQRDVGESDRGKRCPLGALGGGLVVDLLRCGRVARRQRFDGERQVGGDVGRIVFEDAARRVGRVVEIAGVHCVERVVAAIFQAFRIQLDGAPSLTTGIRETQGAEVRDGEVVVSRKVRRIQLDEFFVVLDGLVGVVLDQLEVVAERPVAFALGHLVDQRQRLAPHLLRLFAASGIRRRRRPSRIRPAERRILFDRLLVVRDRLIVLAVGRQLLRDRVALHRVECRGCERFRLELARGRRIAEGPPQLVGDAADRLQHLTLGRCAGGSAGDDVAGGRVERFDADLVAIPGARDRPCEHDADPFPDGQ